MEVLEEKTRIYYAGDMANDEGFGIIVKLYQNKWGRFYNILMDDGREINGLHTIAFSETYKGHGGTRFVTEDAYNIYYKNINLNAKENDNEINS